MRSPPPVLLIAFNRVDTLAEVIRALAPVAPSRMYVAADGPRAGRPDEAERCALVRRMLTDLPWRCEIKTRFLDANAGCARGVSGAISWFFEQESEGIVLEDDCVPDPSFFPYCAEMLERYSMNERVMSVLGTRYSAVRPTQESSYTFSRFFSAWGWASWRRAWNRYELDLHDWRANLPVHGKPLPTFGAPSNINWARKLDGVARQQFPHTWDYQWSFAHMRHDALCVLPKANLVSNIGQGPGATHSARGTVWLDLPRIALQFPLIDPPAIEPDIAADAHRERWHLNHRWWLARKWWQIRNRHAIGSVNARRGWSG